MIKHVLFEFFEDVDLIVSDFKDKTNSKIIDYNIIPINHKSGFVKIIYSQSHKTTL